VDLGIHRSRNHQNENVDNFGRFFYRGEKSADVLKSLARG
jgi:hypothetical protein